MTDPTDLQQASQQIEALEAVGKILQECQASLPLPTAEELAHIREVRQALTPETYRLGVYQRVMVAIENAVSDLRAVCEEATPEELLEIQLSGDEVNAIEAAVEALRASGK